MKMRKRCLALLLALALCAGLPAAAHAAETRVALTLHTTDSSDSVHFVEAGALAAFRDLAPEHWAYFEIMEAANDHGCVKTNGIEHWE